MADTTETPAAPAPTGPTFENVTLSVPLVRGDISITSITLRKPQAGELRGLTLQALFNSEIVALLTLIPRISEPVLTAGECDKLDPSDLMEIGGTIRGFFMTKAEKQVLEAVLAEHQPKT